MTRQNAAILSEVSPSATPVKPEPDRQRTLPVGPTGKVVRGGGVPWHKRLALVKAPSPTAHHVLLVLGSFVSDGQSEAWPSVATLASMTGLSHRGVQTALRALEDDHLVQTETVSGRSSRYRLASTPAGGAPLPPQEVHPPPAGGAPEGTKEVVKGSTSAPAIQDIGSSDPKRHVCQCGRSWPKAKGDTCFTCHVSVLPGRSGKLDEYAARLSHQRRGYNAGQAVPEPVKYDDLF